MNRRHHARSNPLSGNQGSERELVHAIDIRDRSPNRKAKDKTNATRHTHESDQRGDHVKRVSGFALRPDKGGYQVLVNIEGQEPLVVDGDTLTKQRAQQLAEGYAQGLRGIPAVAQEMIDHFSSDKTTIGRMEVPLDLSPSGPRALFQQGFLDGLHLAIRGYSL